MLFFIERNRMNYIRDHCKSIVFDVIKTRCLRNVSNLYIISQKMFKELNNMYDKFDVYKTADATLYNFNFDMSMQKKKTFDEFLIRYIIIIALLQLSKQQKISQLTRIISRRLRLLTINDIKSVIFKDYMIRLR